MKKRSGLIFTVITLIAVLLLSSTITYAESGLSFERKDSFEDILSYYDGKEIALSERLQIIQNNVNFRKAPGGDVLGRLQGGTILECLDETQYKGELWYYARSAEYGEGGLNVHLLF